MKGATVASPGAKLEAVSDLEVPEPGEGQILVKSIYAAINPADVFMSEWGLLVTSWPLVPGCETGGVVVKTGPNAANPVGGGSFKEGDEVCGCTRLGMKGYSPWQEYFLMDAQVTIPKPSSLSLAEAATIGVGATTAFLGVFDGLKVPLLNPETLPEAKEEGEWALVFGGASSVGKFAVQALKLAGFRVAATCSAKSFELVKSLGADVVVDYKESEEDQVAALKSATAGNLDLIMDAVSVNNALATSIFTAFSSTSSTKRYYATTNDWDPLPTPSETSGEFETYPIKLGPIGRPEAEKSNATIAKFVPVIVKLIDAGKLKVGGYVVEGEGVEGLAKAWELQKSGKAGSDKVLVKIADP